MEENNVMAPGYPTKYYIVEVGIMLLGALGIWFLGLEKQQTENELLAKTMLTILGLAATGFQFRNAFLRGELDYDNGKYPLRYWFFMALGLALSFGCSFMPVTGWPMVPLFVMLVLFSEAATGILSGTVLLLIAIMLSGASVGCFALYIISGLFAVALFRKPEKDFKIGFSLFLSMLCLLVCLAVYVVLLSHERLDLDVFMIPVTNVILSAILLVIGTKLFTGKVIYREWNRYAEINSAENPALVKFREERTQDYNRSIHIAHFCERLGREFQLDTDAVKCAAYYYGLGEKLKSVMEECHFPQTAVDILAEYGGNKKKPQRKETAVLLCSDRIITGISFLSKHAREKKVDYEKAVDAIFRKLWEDGYFENCALSVAEIHTMQRIFKEEKQYYDILH